MCLFLLQKIPRVSQPWPQRLRAVMGPGTVMALNSQTVVVKYHFPLTGARAPGRNGPRGVSGRECTAGSGASHPAGKRAALGVIGDTGTVRHTWNRLPLAKGGIICTPAKSMPSSTGTSVSTRNGNLVQGHRNDVGGEKFLATPGSCYGTISLLWNALVERTRFCLWMSCLSRKPSNGRVMGDTSVC